MTTLTCSIFKRTETGRWGVRGHVDERDWTRTGARGCVPLGLPGQYRFRYGTKAEAETEARRIRALHGQISGPSQRIDETVRAFLDAKHPHVRPQTYANLHNGVRYWLDYLSGHPSGPMLLSDITVGIMDGFPAWCKQIRPLTDATVNVYLTAANQWIGWLRRQDFTLPACLVKHTIAKFRVQQARRVEFTQAQFEMLLVELPPEAAWHVQLLGHTGLRAGELCWSWGDEDRHARFDGIDWQHRRLYLPEQKGKRAEPVVLTQTCLDILTDQRARRPDAVHIATLHVEQLRLLVRAVVQQHPDWNERLTLHSLRHMYVTQLFNLGIPPHVIQRMARHTNIQTTMQYAHAHDAGMNTGATTLDKSFGHVQHLRIHKSS